jgi:hypothetical protein
MRTRTLLGLASVLAAVLSCFSPASAQSDRGAITGTVTDPQGAVVANAKVTATNLETGETRETRTTAEGSYILSELRAGPYRLSVEAPGFKTATIDRIQVAVQVTRRADVKLEVGQLGETVSVSAEASLLQTDSPAQQLNVTERQVRELPLLVAAESGGRTPLAFIFLDSSVTPGEDAAGSTGTNATRFRVGGGQALGTDILIDGAGTRRAENGTYFSEVAPGPNAFQEFTITTNNYSAEYGKSSGGIVNFTIKTGSNDFHGEAYLFHRNEALNANIDLNRLLGLPKPRDRQFDYGFSLGGPVYLPRFGEGGKAYWSGKNRTFFFFNYGGYRTSQSENVFVSVPTAKMRRGDFSELLTDPYVLRFFGGPVQIYDPRRPPGQRVPIPGNRLDLYDGGALISRIGQNFVNLFPLPNTTGPLGSTVYHNYLASSTAEAVTNYYVTKITHTLTDRQQLNFSYIFRKLPSIKGGFPRFPPPFVAQGVWQQQFRSYYARLQHDWTLTPTLLNHFNLAFNRTDVENRNYSSLRNHLQIGPSFQRGMTAESLGMPPGTTQNLGLPLIGFPLYGDPVTSLDPRAYQPGGSTFFDNRTADNTTEISDAVSYVRGRHTLKFGADVRIQQLNVSQKFDIGGNFNFRSNQTANTNDFNQGWPIASLIVGAPEFSFNSLQTVDPGWRFFMPSVFFQDDIKVTPKLTLNIGIRYDLDYPRTEAHDRYRGFDPDKRNPAAGGRLGAIAGAAGQGGVQSDYRGLIKPDHSEIGPRFGFAYAIDSKTVIRGGYGLYYAPILYNDFGNTGLLGYNPGQVNINFGLDSWVRGDGTPGIRLETYPKLPIANPGDQAVGQLDRNDIDYFTKNYRAGRTAQYSLDLQRQLPFKLVLSVSYNGHHGTRLRSAFAPVNVIPLNALKLGYPILTKRLTDLTPLERAYAQSLGFNLPTDPNAVYPGFANQSGTLAGTVAQALRPFPQYRVINNRMESEGQSWYNAGKVDLQRRFAQGFLFGISYTYSKLITDAAENLFGETPLSGVVQNPYDRRSLRAVSPNSFPHSLVFNYIIELPFGRGKRFLDRGGWIDRLVGGFQIAGVHRYRSGPALTPFIAGGQRDFLDILGVGGNLRPNLTGQPFYTNTPAGGINYRYLNPAAFSRPPDYRAAPPFTLDGVTVNPAYAAYYANPLRFFGTAAPTYNNLRGQPFFNEDFSIMKKTRVTEKTYFEIRAEFFNLFNRGRFALPNMNLDDVNFGISGRNGDIFQPRRIQVGARFVF